MRIERQQRSAIVELLIAITLPLAILATAYALYQSTVGEGLLHIGPLDRAAFGWIVVMPVAWAAPGLAGLVWSRLSGAGRLLSAVVVGGTVAIVAGVLLANSIDQVGCAPVLTWTDDLPGSLAVGVVIGAGPSLGAFFAASVALRTTGLRRVLASLATGAIIGFVGLFAALETFSLFFPGVNCAPVPA